MAVWLRVRAVLRAAVLSRTALRGQLAPGWLTSACVCGSPCAHCFGREVAWWEVARAILLPHPQCRQAVTAIRRLTRGAAVWTSPTAARLGSARLGSPWGKASSLHTHTMALQSPTFEWLTADLKAVEDGSLPESRTPCPRFALERCTRFRRASQCSKTPARCPQRTHGLGGLDQHRPERHSAARLRRGLP